MPREPLKPGPYYDEMEDVEQRAVHAGLTFLNLTYTMTPHPRLPIPIKNDPRGHRNWTAFVKLIMLCDQLSQKFDRVITPREFMRTILFRSYDERDDFKVYPNMLISTWAIDRWMALKDVIGPERNDEDRRLDLMATLKATQNYLALRLRQYPVENLPELLAYKNSGRIFPEVCLWILNGVITIPWCVLSRPFWKWAWELPRDVREEYIPLDRIKESRKKLLAHPQLWSQFREIMGDILLSHNEVMAMS